MTTIKRRHSMYEADLFYTIKRLDGEWWVGIRNRSNGAGHMLWKAGDRWEAEGVAEEMNRKWRDGEIHYDA